MSERKTITITVPYTSRATTAANEDFIGARGGTGKPRLVLIGHANIELAIEEEDVGRAVLVAWPTEPAADWRDRVLIEALLIPVSAPQEERERCAIEIMRFGAPAVAYAVEQAWTEGAEAERRATAKIAKRDAATDYAKRLAEIEADHAAYESETHGPALMVCGQRKWLLAQFRAASEVLTAAGIPDDGRPLAEKIGALQAALRAAKVLAEDGTLGLVAEDIKRAAAMLSRVENGCVVEHHCADPSACPLCAEPTPEDLARGDAAIAQMGTKEATIARLAELDSRLAADVADLAARYESDPGYSSTALGDDVRLLPSLAAWRAEASLAKLMTDPTARARFNQALGTTARIRVLPVPEYPVPLEPNMRAYINKEFDLAISVEDLAQALRISVEDMRAIEAGEKTTDAEGRTEIQTALFMLGSGSKPEHIADPASSPSFAKAMAAEEEAPSTVHYMPVEPTATCGLTWTQATRFSHTDEPEDVRGCEACEAAAKGDTPKPSPVAPEPPPAVTGSTRATFERIAVDLEELLESVEDAGVSGWTLPSGSHALVKAPNGHLSVVSTGQIRSWVAKVRELRDLAKGAAS